MVSELERWCLLPMSQQDDWAIEGGSFLGKESPREGITIRVLVD